MSEHQQQAATVSWFKWNYRKYAGCIVALPNGTYLHGTKGQRSAQAAKLKAEGMKPGASDLFVCVARGGFHGLWIEMKDQGKTYCSVTQDQRDHIELMIEMGYAAEWCAGTDEAKSTIEKYMGLNNGR